MRALSGTKSTSARVPLALAALALAAASCTSTAAVTTTTSTTVPLTVPSTTTTTEPIVDLHGGVAVVALEEEPFTLNPFFAGDQD